MKNKLFILGLSTLLLASCASPKSLSLEEQLSVNYNIDNLNVELNDYSTMYQNSIKSTFLILNCIETDRGPQITSTGSGFAYKTFGVDDYYVITNHHVAPDITRKYFIVTYTGQIIPATFIGTAGSNPGSKDDFLDLSILKVNDVKDVKLATIVNNGDYKLMTPPNVGDSVYALGNPANINLFGSITKGVVSHGRRIIRNSSIQNVMLQEHAIQIDLPINPGNSGGPLFNDKGEVIGVNTFKLTKNQSGEGLTGLNFSLPIHDMVIAADYIISKYNGTPVKFKPFNIGSCNLIDINTMDLADKKRYGINDDIVSGIYVKYSNNSSIPSKSIIVKASEYDVIDSYDLRRALIECKENKINVSLINDKGQTVDTVVDLVK